MNVTNSIQENWHLLRLNSFFNSKKLSSIYKPVFVKSFISISNYDERNLQRLVGHKWITRQDDKLKVDLNLSLLDIFSIFGNCIYLQRRTSISFRSIYYYDFEPLVRLIVPFEKYHFL